METKLTSDVENLEIQETVSTALATKSNITLGQLFEYMQMIDDGIINLNENQLVELRDRFLDKVDNYKGFMDKVEAEIAFLKQREKEISTVRKAMEKTLIKIDDYALFHMKNNNIDRLCGDLYQAKYVCKKANKVSFKNSIEPNQDLYMKYREFGFVKQAFSWSLDAIKKAIKAGKCGDITDFVELVDSESVTWSINKKI
jgi:hypothetical protein